MLHRPRFVERWRSHPAGGKRPLRDARHANRHHRRICASTLDTFARARWSTMHVGVDANPDAPADPFDELTTLAIGLEDRAPEVMAPMGDGRAAPFGLGGRAIDS